MHKYYIWFRHVNDWDSLPVDSTLIFGFWLCVLFALFIIGLIFYLLYTGIDSWTSFKKGFAGVIIDKSHHDSTLSTGTGIGVTSGGQMAVIATSSGSPESWSIIVKEHYTAEVVKLDVSMQYVYDCKIGAIVEYTKRYGGLSKSLLDTELIKPAPKYAYFNNAIYKNIDLNK